MLSSQIIPCFQHALAQYREQSSEQQSITSVEYTSKTIQLNWSEEPQMLEGDIQTIARYILSLHAPLCDVDIPGETLIAHMTMLAPNIPLDSIPIFQDAICGQISSLELLEDRLQAAQERTSNRTTPKTQELGWDLEFDTHIGKRKALLGQTNQDYFYAQKEGEDIIFLVADGISICTAGSGNLASNIAVQVVHHMYQEQKENLRTMNLKDIEQFLCHVLQNANFNICETAKNLSPKGIEEEIPMGSTIILGYAKGSDVVLTSMGDSRAYLITEDGPAILTGDHNVRGERLRMGLPRDPSSNGKALIRYLGHFNEDFESSLPKPEIRHFRMLSGEKLLICSDGYNDYAATDHAELCTRIMEAIVDQNLDVACNSLIHQANTGGGGDNVTVLLAELLLT